MTTHPDLNRLNAERLARLQNAIEFQGLVPPAEVLGAAGVTFEFEEQGGGIVAIVIIHDRGDYLMVTASEVTEGLYMVGAYDGDDGAMYEDVGGDYALEVLAEKVQRCIAWLGAIA